MTRRSAYLNARLLDPASGLDVRGGLLAVDGKIADFGPRVFADGVPGGVDVVVDCEGLCLAPGLVDMRVQIGEPGAEEKETIPTASRAAAAGGITSLVCLPGTEPPIDDVSTLEFIARRAREAKLVKIFVAPAVTRGLEGRQLTEMGLLAEEGAVAFTDGHQAVADAAVMARALNYAKVFDKPIMQHPEEPSLSAGGQMNAGERATRLGLKGINRLAEVMMIERDLRLVELTGGRYHAAHLSTGAAVEAIRAAKRRGLPVTCDTAPPYFALTEVDVGDYRTFAKLSPPLRGEMDRRAIVEGLADGTIDAVASDHRPHDQDSKRVPFDQAAAGGVGLETLLPLVLELHHKGTLTLLAALALVTHRPAAILGMEAGRMRVGAPADLVLFDPDVPWKIEERALRSKSKNTPFDKRPTQGRAVRTVVDGRTVFLHGH
jgi:dihydroorotase